MAILHRHRDRTLRKACTCRCKDCVEIVRHGWFYFSEEQQDYILEHGLNEDQRLWLDMRMGYLTVDRFGFITGEVAAIHWFAEALRACPEVPADFRLPVGV